MDIKVIQESKEKTLETLGLRDIEYDVQMRVKTIKIEDHANSGDNVREGFKLYYSVIDDRLLFGYYWLMQLDPPKQIYKETTLTPEELQQVVTWIEVKKRG